VTDDPEEWASILGWHCWREAAGIWCARRADTAPADVLRAANLDDLRAAIDYHEQRNPSPIRTGTGPDLLSR
jgi:hypothetical protein